MSNYSMIEEAITHMAAADNSSNLKKWAERTLREDGVHIMHRALKAFQKVNTEFNAARKRKDTNAESAISFLGFLQGVSNRMCWAGRSVERQVEQEEADRALTQIYGSDHILQEAGETIGCDSIREIGTEVEAASLELHTLHANLTGVIMVKVKGKTKAVKGPLHFMDDLDPFVLYEDKVVELGEDGITDVWRVRGTAGTWDEVAPLLDNIQSELIEANEADEAVALGSLYAA